VSPETVPDVLAEADLLFNISGHLTGWLRDLPGRSAYIDLDPGYTQFWNTAGVVHGSRLDGHDVYFTVGQNVGQSECAIPTCGLEWRPALPPSTVEEPPEALGDPGRFTTVGSWRGSFGRIEAGGTTYGLKAHEFRRFAGLPRDVPGVIFEVALDIDPADHKDRRALEENGWRLIDPLAVAGEPAAYRHYIRNSWAEFSAAQGIYVETKSGWFSDRSVRYLASGKPVLVQDTGFGRTLPVGEGLLAFRTLDEAAAGVREIERDYDGHAKAARALAEEYFDSDRILGRMLEEVGVSP